MNDIPSSLMESPDNAAHKEMTTEQMLKHSISELEKEKHYYMRRMSELMEENEQLKKIKKCGCPS
jgi:hypothetical protein